VVIAGCHPGKGRFRNGKRWLLKWL